MNKKLKIFVIISIFLLLMAVSNADSKIKDEKNKDYKDIEKTLKQIEIESEFMNKYKAKEILFMEGLQDNETGSIFAKMNVYEENYQLRIDTKKCVLDSSCKGNVVCYTCSK